MLEYVQGRVNVGQAPLPNKEEEAHDDFFRHEKFTSQKIQREYKKWVGPFFVLVIHKASGLKMPRR